NAKHGAAEPATAIFGFGRRSGGHADFVKFASGPAAPAGGLNWFAEIFQRLDWFLGAHVLQRLDRFLRSGGLCRPPGLTGSPRGADVFQGWELPGPLPAFRFGKVNDLF